MTRPTSSTSKRTTPTFDCVRTPRASRNLSSSAACSFAIFEYVPGTSCGSKFGSVPARANVGALRVGALVLHGVGAPRGVRPRDELRPRRPADRRHEHRLAAEPVAHRRHEAHALGRFDRHRRVVLPDQPLGRGEVGEREREAEEAAELEDVALQVLHAARDELGDPRGLGVVVDVEAVGLLAHEEHLLGAARR